MIKTSRTLDRGHMRPYWSTADMPVADFTPDLVSGLQLWLSADSITGLSDGDAIAAWNDRSTAVNDFTQATSGHQPLFKANKLNSLPAVQFDGVDDFLSGTSIITSSPVSIFIVSNLTSSSTQQAILTLSDLAVYAMGSSGGSGWGVYADTGYASDITMTSTFRLIEVLSSSITNLVLRDNGTAVSTFSPPGSWYPRGETTLGQASGVQPFGGNIAEVLCYDSELTGDDLTNVETYLKTKYALS